MTSAATHHREGSVRLIVAVLGVAILAWTGVIALHGTLTNGTSIPRELQGLLSYCGNPPDVAGPGFGNWILGWTLMVVAMMLPPTLPLLRAGEKILYCHTDRSALLLTLLAAFVAVWVLAGVVLFAAGSLVRTGLHQLPPAMNRPDVVAGVAAMAVGLFQFTPLKMACMDACRSPTAVMLVHWRAARPHRSALQVGARYGAICVGCCWATMLLGVLAGALMLPIMVLCALLMTLERLLPSVRALMPLQAGFAIAIGVALLAGAIPQAFF